MFKPGDRVVHWDAEWHEYETVERTSEVAPGLQWLVTTEGNGDFSDNFRLYEPEFR